jgi:hypothetical protein
MPFSTREKEPKSLYPGFKYPMAFNLKKFEPVIELLIDMYPMTQNPKVEKAIGKTRSRISTKRSQYTVGPNLPRPRKPKRSSSAS